MVGSQEKKQAAFSISYSSRLFYLFCLCSPHHRDGDVPQEKEPDVMPKNCPFFLEKTASEWAFTRIGTGMIGTNHSKTHIVVVVVPRIVVVPGGAAQSISYEVSQAPRTSNG
jgi:hypothetical protein